MATQRRKAEELPEPSSPPRALAPPLVQAAAAGPRAAAPSGKAGSVSLGSVAACLVPLVVAVLQTTAGSFFSLDPHKSIWRTAIFLLIFLVVHMLGNLFVLAGPEALNSYGYLLHINPLLKFIEWYLLLAGLFHAGAGAYLTYSKRKSLFKGGVASSAGKAKLALSGIGVLVFILIHLKQFKFGPYYEYVLGKPMNIEVYTVEAGTKMRDLHKLMRELFADAWVAHGYVLGVCILGGHLSWGMRRTVPKLGLERRHVEAATLVCQLGVFAVTAGFAVSPLYVHYVLLRS